MLKITFSELEKQPSWWVDDMLDIITTKNKVESDEMVKQQLKNKGKTPMRGRRR